MSIFKATVQYQDWNGTAAADDADNNKTLSAFLEGKGLMKDTESLIASSLWIGENKGGKLGSVSIAAYLFDRPSFDTVKAALDSINGPIPVRKVDVEVSLEEYIAFFKRFAVIHTRNGLNIEGREYTLI